MAEHLTENNFNSAIQSGVTLVDFFATWCGPCKMLSPVIEELAAEASGFSVYKVDIDECEDLAMDYSVMSVPTLIIFKDGEEAERLIGVRSKADILNVIQSFV
ncbi:MAG: thioredoxin [Ruminococcus sp.]|nr:thioredoxin [Ruminococcus sp.]